MNDSLPTVWPISPHTQAKHAILKRYLSAWMPILSRQSASIKRKRGESESRRILYIDGFAGPGVYERGEPGSPIIAIRAAVNHSHEFPFPIDLTFIEKSDERYTRLRSEIAKETIALQNCQNIKTVEPLHGDCDTTLNRLLDDHERNGTKFGPALAFLDQFGYGEVSMNLVARILAYPQCEVFTYLDYKDMNRWISDGHKASAFDRVFGGPEWRECVHLEESNRREKLLSLYKSALQKRASAKFVTSFLMFDHKSQPLYWLVFCTNNLRGLEEMKRAMWAIDRTGNFRFSDHDASGQLSLLDESFNEQWLAEEMAAKLAGKTLTVAKVKEFVLTETPCYLFKSVLKKLEKQKSLSVVNPPVGRRPGNYPDDMHDRILVRFPGQLF